MFQDADCRRNALVVCTASFFRVCQEQIKCFVTLQASSRPSSAKENRITRATALREEHRTQAMSAVPSNDTKMQLKRT